MLFTLYVVFRVGAANRAHFSIVVHVALLINFLSKSLHAHNVEKDFANSTQSDDRIEIMTYECDYIKVFLLF